jgi:purine-binding chemotaxis protein CheW
MTLSEIWTAEARSERPPPQAILVFWIGRIPLAVDIAQVDRVIEVSSIEPVPEAPPFLEGIVPLRKRVIPVIRLLPPADAPPAASTEATAAARRIIVTRRGADRPMGILVDRTEGIRKVPASFLPRQEGDDKIYPPYVTGWIESKEEGRLLTVIAPELVLTDEEFQPLQWESLLNRPPRPAPSLPRAGERPSPGRTGDC